MIATIQKWGNGLGLRIPKNVAQEAKIQEGTSVELRVEEGRLIIARQDKRKHILTELVDKITPESMHGETDWGYPVGKEVW